MRDLSSIFPVVVCVLVLAFNPARADDDKETLKKITELQSKVIQLQDENSKLKEELAGLKSPSAKSAEKKQQPKSERKNEGDRLGRIWKAVDAKDWGATWIRRGDSNVFDVTRQHSYGPTRQTYVAEVTLSGNSVQATAIIDGLHHVYQGTLTGRKITGSFDFPGRKTVHTWEVEITE